MLKRSSLTLDRLKGRFAALLTGSRSAEAPVQVPKAPPMQVKGNVTIPICDISTDDTSARKAQDRGQFLARQDRWDELVHEIHAADQARSATAGGMPIAELMAFGARSDVVLAVEHALLDDCGEDVPSLNEGIHGLESIRRDMPNDPIIATIVALAHVDVGWAWRGTGWGSSVPEINRQKYMAHFERAAEILSPFNGIELDSPLVASAQCALLAGQADPHARIADDYEDLIDLNPGNYRHMRALGYHLLPNWFGSYEDVDLQARRTAARTEDIWGAGGYTWVCFDAIAIDERACAHVDADFFVDGLKDIVALHPEQEMINLLAAYCAVAMRQGQGTSSEADLPRMQIIECAEWLIRDHLTEVHPLIWAHAQDGFDNNARVTSLSRFAARGRDYALQVISDMFRDDINRGIDITFTPDGPKANAA